MLGQPALNFAFADGLRRYHTTQDDIAHLDPGSVQHHGVQALALTNAACQRCSFRGHARETRSSSLFRLVGLVVYPERFALPLAMMAGVLVVIGCIRLRRIEPRWVRGVSFGGVGTVVAGGLGVARHLESRRPLSGSTPQCRRADGLVQVARTLSQS